MSKVVKKKLKIEGMHCTSCALNIDFDLEDLEGVEKAKTSYAKQECIVEFEEGKISEDLILEAIKKSGYKAVIVDF